MHRSEAAQCGGQIVAARSQMRERERAGFVAFARGITRPAKGHADAGEWRSVGVDDRAPQFARRRLRRRGYDRTQQSTENAEQRPYAMAHTLSIPAVRMPPPS